MRIAAGSELVEGSLRKTVLLIISTARTSPATDDGAVAELAAIVLANVVANKILTIGLLGSGVNKEASAVIREAETAEGHREQAFRRAAHAAFLWPEEGPDIAAAGRSLTELAGIGHSLAKRLHNWIASPSEVEVPAIRREFLTLAHARRVLKKIRDGRRNSKAICKCTQRGATAVERSRT